MHCRRLKLGSRKRVDGDIRFYSMKMSSPDSSAVRCISIRPVPQTRLTSKVLFFLFRVVGHVTHDGYERLKYLAHSYALRHGL